MTMEKEQVHSRRMDTSQLGNGEKIPLHLTRTGPPKQTKEEADVKTEVTGKPPQNCNAPTGVKGQTLAKRGSDY